MSLLWVSLCSWRRSLDFISEKKRQSWKERRWAKFDDLSSTNVACIIREYHMQWVWPKHLSCCEALCQSRACIQTHANNIDNLEMFQHATSTEPYDTLQDCWFPCLLTQTCKRTLNLETLVDYRSETHLPTSCSLPLPLLTFLSSSEDIQWNVAMHACAAMSSQMPCNGAQYSHFLTIF